ncbi:MAG TPA: ATP-binding protein [Pseudonocardiaceae bacterium]|nr:ATP-binding protein [Pseudonocardiaceae bacterium]
MSDVKQGEVLTLTLVSEQDVFLIRQRGRQVAALVGLENQDQVRVATALSELGRELTTLKHPATVTWSLIGDVTPMLLMNASWAGPLPGVSSAAELATLEGVTAAARLTDTCDVGWSADGGSVALTKRLPAGAPPPTAARVAQVRYACRTAAPVSAFDEMRHQNQELLEALETLRARQEDLLRVNAELEETNRGVLALHTELSDELEQTNRGVVALYAELDERSKELREASESKTRFWRNVSHELRTPINAVVGLSRLLLDPGSDPLTDEQRHQIQLIEKSATLLLTQVNELLDVAKAESGRIEAHLEPVDLRALFEGLRSTLRPLVPSPDVVLAIEDPVGITSLVTDPALLGQILRNLISNGLKFTERGEVRCRVRAIPAAECLEITVTDTGIGIPPEHQQRVFEEFHQVPGRLQAHARGTGLGLPHARRLTGILGGSLHLDSEPGRGTEVTLRLPLIRADRDERAPDRFGSVLIVDDDPAFRTVLRSTLAAHADHIAEAGDGQDALRMMRAGHPDLVLLDLSIPPPEGRAVLAEMRQDPRLRTVAVVVVTSAELSPDEHAAISTTASVLAKSSLSGALLLSAVAVATRLSQEAP